MSTLRAMRWVTYALTILLASNCSSEPSVPLGTLSPEQAQKLALERDEARDALAERERVLQREIADLKAEVHELRASGSVADVEVEDSAVEPEALPGQRPAMAIDLTSVSAKPIRNSGSYTYFSWQAKVKNNLDRAMAISLYVSFQDSEGFELDDARERLVLQAQEERALTGVEMIANESANRVEKVSGRIEQ